MGEECICYDNLVYDIDQIVPKLKIIIEKLDKADRNLQKQFTIDDNRIDGKRIFNLKEKIEDYRNFLENDCRQKAEENYNRLKEEIESSGASMN